MIRNDVFGKLNDIFQEVFDDASITVNESTTAECIDGWDSLTHITLINEIEDAFDIRFPMKKVISMKNVGEMVDYIMEELE